MLMMLSKDVEPTNHLFLPPLFRQIGEMLGTCALHPSNTSAYVLEETDDTYVMSFDVPGVQREDLNIELLGNRLQISGERKGSNKSSSFQHLFMLPEGIQADGIAADLKDGVLKLCIQKPASVKSIKIKIGEDLSKTNFLKNLIGEKKGKDSIEIKKESEAVVT